MAAITPNWKSGTLISYRFRTCVGRDETGKQIFRTTTWKAPDSLTPSKADRAAKREAEIWESEVRAEYKKDLQNPQRIKDREIDGLRTDFKTFVLQDWFPISINNGERKPKTIDFYSYTSQAIVEYFSGRILQKITATEIQKYLIALRTERGLSAQTVHHYHRTLNMIFAFAVKQEMIRKNPMDKVERPKLPRNKVDALSQEEAKIFFSALDTCPLNFRCMLYLMITTGLRRGECCGLKWSDIDEAACTITIQRNVTYTPASGITASTPKTATSFRVVPLMASTLEMLRRLKQQTQKENPSALLETA